MLPVFERYTRIVDLCSNDFRRQSVRFSGFCLAGSKEIGEGRYSKQNENYENKIFHSVGLYILDILLKYTNAIKEIILTQRSFPSRASLLIIKNLVHYLAQFKKLINNQMPIIKYQDIRGVDKNSNPFTTHRPSGKTRIVKGTLQYGLFQTFLNYGFIFNGFGLHSYFNETIGKIERINPWMRTQTLATNFLKYGLIALPFFYSKEVIFSSLDSFTKDKPSLRKIFNYSFVVNFIATGFIFPVFYFIEKRNMVKSVRSSLALCLFSLVNDVFIDLRRKQLIVQNFSRQQLQQMFVKNRISDVRQQIKQELKDSHLDHQKRVRLQNLNLEMIQKQMMSMTTPKTYQIIEKQRKDELSKVGQVLRSQLDSIKNLTNMFQKK